MTEFIVEEGDVTAPTVRADAMEMTIVDCGCVQLHLIKGGEGLYGQFRQDEALRLADMLRDLVKLARSDVADQRGRLVP